jgi:hypothetical protein
MTVAAIPEIIRKLCLTCRRETEHRYSATVKGITLYACRVGCGSPLRGVSDPQSLTPAAHFLRQVELKRWQQESKREAEKDKVYDHIHPQRQIRRTPAKEKKMPKDTPLVKLIKKVVENMGGGITEDRVREIFREEIEAQLPGEESAAAAEAEGLTHPKVTRENCPRMPHKGQHGKACQAALEAAS